MTSIPANVHKYFAGSRTEQPKTQTADSGQDFSKVLDRQKTSTPKDNGVKAAQQKQVSETDGAPKQEQASGQTDTKVSEQPQDDQLQSEETALQQDQTTEQAGEVNQPQTDQPAAEVTEEMPAEELEQVMEVLQSAILQIQQLLQQQLDITPEDLQQLMQEKGITELDLLQPETVNQLVLDAVGAEDNLELVMDENLYQSQQTISREFQEISQKLKQDLASDGEELPQVLEKLESSVSGMGVQRPETAAENPQQSDPRGHGGAEQEKGQERNVTGQVFFQNYTAQAQNQTVSQQISAMASAGKAHMWRPRSHVRL